MPFKQFGTAYTIDHRYFKRLELRQTLILDPTGYVGAPSPELESRNARRRSPAIQNRPNNEAGFLQTNKHLPHATTTPQPYKRHSQEIKVQRRPSIQRREERIAFGGAMLVIAIKLGCF
ncbi:hypothetical protein CRG98_021522 [Punica granatum]|uniref:Uncharacterized protein n=1 Tax=Punica granatum TaxID=22663 RepID=A0A2I0JP67_PUNGR|nr:hypothetical protein CRG98_021522 [Punica granatum]